MKTILVDAEIAHLEGLERINKLSANDKLMLKEFRSIKSKLRTSKDNSIDHIDEKVTNWGEMRGIVLKGNEKNQFKKTLEEVEELREALDSGHSDKQIMLEIGDIIFTLIGILACRELSLRKTLRITYKKIKNRKGESRDGKFIRNRKKDISK